MNKPLIGIIFIIAGILYGMLALDGFYEKTLGWLVKNEWIKPPTAQQQSEAVSPFGRKSTILLYSFGLIIIGVFILWKQ